MLRWIILLTSHSIVLAIGFALGIYFLPILIAPDGPDKAIVAEVAQKALYTGEFRRGLKGNDFVHWGEGTVSISATKIVHVGRLAPGPDYKLYLVPTFVEDEQQFLAIKNTAQRIGDIKSFEGFLIDVPATVNVDDYTTVLVWCETFSEFITAAKYR
ncbi:MAG: DM13 domain-containing protein [Labrys sp. (in: a-proteobacteria)]